MVKKFFVYFIFIFIFLVTSGCIIDESAEKEGIIENSHVTNIEDLDHIENFRHGSLEHILEGELNKKGQAVGFHYDQLPSKKGQIIEKTKTALDEYGVFEAKVVISGKEKVGNKGISSFFPDHWDTQEVVDAINEAYETKVLITGNTYDGLTKDGMIIRMYIDQNEKIISAFPLYEGE